MNQPILQPFELLPAVHRLRDAEQQDVLRAWFDVLSREVHLLERDIDGLYDNQFIETCDEWAVPYHGELVGVRRPGGDPAAVGEELERLVNRQRLVFPRSEVARSVEFSKRKGTAPVLEELARTIADWPAKVVEFYELTSQFQAAYCSDPRLGRTVDVRRQNALDRVDGPFDEIAHLTDVRELNSVSVLGRYHISHVGLFVWRLRAYSVTETDADCLCRRCCDSAISLYSFDPLGIPGPLFIKPVDEAETTDKAAEHNVPAPLRRLALQDPHAEHPQATELYYGRDKSLAFWIHDPDAGGTLSDGLVPRQNVVPFDLSIFLGKDCGCKAGVRTQHTVCHCHGKEKHRVLEKLEELLGEDKVAVDPESGLLATRGYRRELRTSYHYALSADMGGGEYPRSSSRQYSYLSFIKRIRQPDEATEANLNLALEELFEDKQDASGQTRTVLKKADTILEIADSRLYRLRPVHLSLDLEQTFEIRAARGCRPVILVEQGECDTGIQLDLAPGSSFVLDGLIVAGATIGIGDWEGGLQARPGEDPCQRAQPCDGDPIAEEPAPARVLIRHSTLVPCQTPCGAAGLEIDLPGGCLTLQNTISTGIREPRVVDPDFESPTRVTVLDSIIDGQATGNAIVGERSMVLEIRRSTCFGKVSVRSMRLAQDSIFTKPVTAVRRDEGAMRFSFVRPNGSGSDGKPYWETPPQFYCQPALAYQRTSTTHECDNGQAAASVSNEPNSGNGPPPQREPACEPPDPEAEPTKPAEMLPKFTSRCYGDPAYAQLAHDCPDEIRLGAEDQSEMGVMHDLHQPQRDANLRERLAEFSPFSMHTTIIYAN